MSDLRELLADVAGEAKVYDVTGRAVRAAGRRSRARRYTPIAALLVVVLVVVAVWVPLASRGGSLVAGPVRWLPALVAVPKKVPPVLTEHQRVGRGSLLFRVRDWPGMVLLTENGRHYTVPDAVSISPDGRWLLLGENDRLMVQDLRDGGRQQLSTRDPDDLSLRWSSNGGWLVIGPGPGAVMAPAGDRSIALIEAPSWRPKLISRSSQRAILLAAVDSGNFVTYEVEADGEPSLPPPGWLSLYRPNGGPEAVSLATAAKALRPDENLDPEHQVLGDGSTVMIRTWRKWSEGNATGPVPADILVLDGLSAAVHRRIELPTPSFGSDGTGDYRELAAAAPEGILVWHFQRSAPVELELMDRATGKLTVATRATGDRIEHVYPRGYSR